MPSGMHTGTVAMVNPRGYGFIKPDEGPKDIFFHVSGMADGESFDDLVRNDRVEYEIEETEDRPRAMDVRLVGR